MSLSPLRARGLQASSSVRHATGYVALETTMRKLHTFIALPVLVLGLSLPTLAQVQREETKDPSVSGEASGSKAKEKAPLPATKQMDKASSPEKTGVPERGAATSGKPTHPPTKQMDKAASPDK
jgi:hypothetical protein